MSQARRSAEVRPRASPARCSLFRPGRAAGREAAEATRAEPGNSATAFCLWLHGKTTSGYRDCVATRRSRDGAVLRLRPRERKPCSGRPVPEPQHLRVEQRDEHQRHTFTGNDHHCVPDPHFERTARLGRPDDAGPPALPADRARVYRRQTHPSRELIVVDDGERLPRRRRRRGAGRRPPAPARRGHRARDEAQPRLRGGAGRGLREDGRRRLVRAPLRRDHGGGDARPAGTRSAGRRWRT